MFDLAPQNQETLTWNVHLPLEEKLWAIGLIVGPSGCGKSTISRQLWPEESTLVSRLTWESSVSVLDAFPPSLPIKEVVSLLSAVGFSSPPAWLRPFHVLSTGQQFRVTLARLLADSPHLVLFDEYTSVVDRTVAQIGSAAVSKVIRQRDQQFVAVTCHEDVEEWLQPDWVYRPAETQFSWRSLQRRPQITLTVIRSEASAWELFKPHHYLSSSLAPSAWCFLALWKGQPVAFSAWLPFFGSGPKARREHRTVTLPDYQGVGIGNGLSAHIASMWKALGLRAISTTTHPAMITARNKSPLWRMHRSPSLGGSGDVIAHASTRLTAGFEYIGPAMNPRAAKLLIG
jgi:ABC-type lipoprotein export system ATPase subunit